MAALAQAPFTYTLGAACVLALAYVEAHGSSADAATLVRFGALERGRVAGGEPWRLLTAAFLHAGWLHLACNVAAAVPGCRRVERALGPWPFLLLYLASALGASALSVLGRDAVSVGASGALFGVLGATLVLERRALGSWRAFAASPLARGTIALLVAFSVLGSLVLPLDHLAHAGGLATGAGAAWLGTRPAPAARWPWSAFAAALAALAVAASWPRASASRFEAAELEGSLAAALRADDVAGARALVARAAARHHDSERLRLLRAFLLAQERDLPAAIALARTLRASAEPAVRADAARLNVELARALARHHLAGGGEPWLGSAYLEEACALGDARSCREASAASTR